MAERLTPATAAEDKRGNAMHDMSNRRAAIERAVAEMYGLDRQIADLVEAHIQPLKDERKKIVRDLKADLDIEIADIKLAYAVYARGRDAQGMEEDDGGRIRDNLRELFSTLHRGGQLDWLLAAGDGADAAPSQEAPAPRKNGAGAAGGRGPVTPLERCRAMGKAVGLAGVGDRYTHDNMEPGSPEALAWQEGWDEGQAERAANTTKH